MPRLLVLLSWKALYDTWVGLTPILTALLIKGAINMDVKEATCPFRVPQGEICIKWRILPLFPRQLQVQLLETLTA